MKMNLKSELPILAIALIPIIYLAFIWGALPQEVPIHWNGKGKIDGYGSKTVLMFLALGMPFLIYFIFLLVPKIDPKNKLAKMGNKLQNLKFILTLFMSILTLVIIYSSKNESLANPNYIILALGALIAILGNYFKTIKPNYFIGIRTPWTLESDAVWKATHLLGGKLWFVGGMIIILGSMILDQKPNLTFFLIVVVVIAIIPIVYSYMLFREEKEVV